MTFEHLTDGEFEELTYDLLHALGFVNLDWRRGSGKGGATADQGRDVVGQFRQTDVDGSERFERWFVQCKRYERGVPPEALHGAVAWASAESPDVLLFVVSNFLSNPAKSGWKISSEIGGPLSASESGSASCSNGWLVLIAHWLANTS